MLGFLKLKHYISNVGGGICYPFTRLINIIVFLTILIYKINFKKQTKIKKNNFIFVDKCLDF